MNETMKTMAYINAAEHAGSANPGGDLMVPAIIVAAVGVILIIGSMILYDMFFGKTNHHNGDDDNSYNSRL
jgi:cytochrome b